MKKNENAAGQSAGKGESVETSMQKLEEMLSKLEDEDTTLEESFKLYGQGMKLVKEINGKMDQAEKQMIILEGDENAGV